MDGDQRRHVEEQWLRDYGEPIDCELLRLAASTTTAEGWRLESATKPLYPKVRDLVERQKAELEDLLRKPIPGSSTSFRDLAAKERAAVENAPWLRLCSMARGLEQVLLEYEGARDRCLDEIRSMAEIADEAGAAVASRQRDYAEARAALLVSAWIRDHSPNGKPTWKDVAVCLEYHGHPDISPEACRKAAQRLSEFWEHLPE